MVIVPPYCGAPSLSHQFPVEVVVTVVDVGSDAKLVVDVGIDAEVVVDGSDAKLVVDVGSDSVVVVVLDLLHDASSIAATRKMLKLNQITLFFINTSTCFFIMPCFK